MSEDSCSKQPMDFVLEDILGAGRDDTNHPFRMAIEAMGIPDITYLDSVPNDEWKNIEWPADPQTPDGPKKKLTVFQCYQIQAVIHWYESQPEPKSELDYLRLTKQNVRDHMKLIKEGGGRLSVPSIPPLSESPRQLEEQELPARKSQYATEKKLVMDQAKAYCLYLDECQAQGKPLNSDDGRLPRWFRRDTPPLQPSSPTQPAGVHNKKAKTKHPKAETKPAARKKAPLGANEYFITCTAPNCVHERRFTLPSDVTEADLPLAEPRSARKVDHMWQKPILGRVLEINAFKKMRAHLRAHEGDVPLPPVLCCKTIHQHELELKQAAAARPKVVYKM